MKSKDWKQSTLLFPVIIAFLYLLKPRLIYLLLKWLKIISFSLSLEEN